MTKFLIAFALSAGLTSAADSESASNGESVNPVVQWNRNLLAIVRTAGAQPATVHATRSFAIMHAAIYDAVNSIDRRHQPYLVRFHAPRHASPEAAAAAAAHAVLIALYPAFQSALDDELQQSLAQVFDEQAKRAGVHLGQAVAEQILALREDDGSSAEPLPYEFGTAPGDYQSTPPNFPPQPQFTHWSRVRPFALRRADQFRPGAPPALTSERYADAFNQVKALGIAMGTSATEDEMLTGRFWNGPIQNYWNEIAQSASEARHLTTARSARLFALLNLTFADAVIAFYDAKYTYNFWRPVTAIRAADPDINPQTEPDPDWLPLVGNTPPDPSYPGAHAVISGAGAEVLILVLQRDRINLSVSSEVLPGVQRSFTTFSAAADEAAMSRVFAGVHFGFDETNGQRMGRHIADFVVDHFLTARQRGHEDDDG